MRATIPMLPFLQGVQPMTNRSNPILQTWAFLVTVTITHEHNTTQQSRCWGDRLSITHLSLHLLLCVSVPPPWRLQTKADYHIHEATTWQMKARARERTKPTLYRPSSHIIILSPAITFSIPSMVFLLSVFTAPILSLFLSIMSVNSLFILWHQVRLVCLCVCVSWWITTLIERLNSLYYIM